MSELITVTIAPHATHRVPHPAGPQFGALELGPGETFEVTPQAASRLAARGVIIDPATGMVASPPAPLRRDERVRITTESGTFLGGSGEWAAEQLRMSSKTAQDAFERENAAIAERNAARSPAPLQPQPIARVLHHNRGDLDRDLDRLEEDIRMIELNNGGHHGR
ncbi:MAG: hypothetical protein J0H19_02825 [Rhodospirillales bacterium]|nr:hypothetical protein [Rhodospirillales bacterium]MBN8925535.1 hypothetical protein [Rhodospirillales bacterium]